MSDFVPVAFGTSFESLVARALTPMPPAILPKLQAVGFDPTRPFQAAYPAEVWMETLRVVSGYLFPADHTEEGHRKLGKLYMEGFEKTLMGKAVFTLGRAIGPRRMLPRMTRNFRTANNFIDTDLHEIKEGDWRMLIQSNAEAGPAVRAHTHVSTTFIQGIMEAILELRGCKHVDVRVEQCDAEKGHSVLRLKFGAFNQ